MEEAPRGMARRLSAALDEDSILPIAHGVLVALLRCSPYEADLALDEAATTAEVPALDLAKALIEVYSRHTEGLREDPSLDRAYATVARLWMGDRTTPAAPRLTSLRLDA